MVFGRRCAFTRPASSFASFASSLMAATKFKYESCSVQVKLPDSYIEDIQAWSQKHISDDILYFDPEDSSYGRDTHSHITISLGLDEKDTDKYTAITKDYVGSSLSTKNVVVWNTDKFDLICLTLLPSDVINTINTELTTLADKRIARRKFTPHISIAFIRKGLGNRLIRKMSWHDKHVIEDREWSMDELELVTREGRFVPLHTEES